MNTYIIFVTIIGLAGLAMAWMPAITQRTKVSYSVIYVVLGILIFSLLKTVPRPDPFVFHDYAVHLSELVVIISLMGSGLKIDQPFSRRLWATPFKLVTITMILCIFAVAVLANGILNFDWPSAFLLGAALAPTDPVLANDVQVGPPHEDSRDNVRFSLTAEAGMNDGMAFPFTWLAIMMAMQQGGETFSLSEWLTYYLLYKIAAGVIIGFAVGRIVAYLIFSLPSKKKWMEVSEGFVAITTTLLVYGITELASGYGFIAVFVTAITLRNYEIDHHLHTKLHSFTYQLERLMLAVILIAFGGSLISGILTGLSWPMVGVGLVFLLLIRPLSAMLAMVGAKLHIREKLAISFFGIRGIGSFFYVAFALKEATFKHGAEIWTVVAFIVLASLFIHGLSAKTVLQKLENRFARPVKEKIE